MKESSVIEPRDFTGARVFDNCRAHLPCPQSAIRLPLHAYRRAPAVVFDRRAVRCLKHGLPGQPNAITVITDQQPFLFNEPLSQLRTQPCENFPRVSQRRLPTARGERLAEEI